MRKSLRLFVIVSVRVFVIVFVIVSVRKSVRVSVIISVRILVRVLVMVSLRVSVRVSVASLHFPGRISLESLQNCRNPSIILVYFFLPRAGIETARWGKDGEKTSKMLPVSVFNR